MSELARRHLAITLASLLAMFVATRAAAKCTGCHVTLKEKPGAAHTYEDWERSKHAAAGVSCVNCHGGDSEAEVADEAHIHIDSLAGPGTNQAVWRLALTQGCGNCHRAERESFRRSPHQGALEAGEVAADCTTCHGALGTRPLDPVSITAACRQCHSGGTTGVAVGVAETLMEYYQYVRNAVVLPEPGMRMDTDPRAAAATSIVSAVNALHSLSLDEAGLSPLAEPPHCTGCHIRLRQDPAWSHSYEDWEESLHAYSEVSCVNCHGGDSEAEVAEEAHAGMVLTGRPGADDNRDRLILSEGCGNCHPNEIAGFRASPHYRAIRAGKHAADCVTCHGAVGGHVLIPETITTTCRQCHMDQAPGTTVGVAQTLLEYTHRVRMALTFPEPGQALHGEDRERVEEAITAAMAAWHEFDLLAVGLALAHGTGVLEQ